MQKKETFFVDKYGDLKITFILVLTAVGVAISLWFVLPEVVYGFTHRFFRAGIWCLLGIISFVALCIMAYNYSKSNDNGRPAIGMIALSWVLLFGGLLGPALALKGDRESHIPDIQMYYGNGRVINYGNSKKDNFYFKHYDVSSADSLYITQYGEEPGYNVNYSNVNGFTASAAPRANEDWSRPKYK